MTNHLSKDQFSERDAMMNLVDEVKTFEQPFRHFFSGRVFDPIASEELRRWLEQDVPWTLAKKGFYEQYECNLLNVDFPQAHAWVCSSTTLHELKCRMESLLKTKLRRRVTQISAHRMVPGQGIGIHTDEPREGRETHRLVVQLTKQFQDSDGGFLMFFNSRDPSDLHAAFRPLHNTGVGFVLSPRSYHAVSDVHGGTRYTLVYSFLSVTSRKDSGVGLQW